MRFQRAVLGQTYLRFHKRVKITKKNKIIAECSQFFNDGAYDVGKFLQQTVFLGVIGETSLETNDNIEDLEAIVCDITRDDSDLCAICCAKRRDVVFLPCSHLGQCSDCLISDHCVICGMNDVTAVFLRTS